MDRSGKPSCGVCEHVTRRTWPERRCQLWELSPCAERSTQATDPRPCTCPLSSSRFTSSLPPPSLRRRRYIAFPKPCIGERNCCILPRREILSARLPRLQRLAHHLFGAACKFLGDSLAHAEVRLTAIAESKSRWCGILMERFVLRCLVIMCAAGGKRS